MSSVGTIFVPSPLKTGTNWLRPLPPQSVNGSADEDVIFVLGAAVVQLTGHMIDERLRPGRDVLLEQSVESVVQCGADEVAICIHPGREHRE